MLHKTSLENNLRNLTRVLRGDEIQQTERNCQAAVFFPACDSFVCEFNDHCSVAVALTSS